MISLFEVENNVVKPTVHCKMIKWLSIIEKKFDNYLDIYAYIFYMSYHGKENPYFNVKLELRDATIRRDLKTEIDTEADEIIEALEKATVLYTTPTMRAHRGISQMLDNMVEYMEDAKITAGRDGNLPALIKLAKDFDGIRQSYKGIAKDLAEEQKSTVFGGQDLAYDQQKR